MNVTWSRTRTLVAGITLVALTNAIALVGVAYNRSGEPESVLKLTQRELSHPYRFGIDKDVGGLELTLRSRVLNAESAASFYADHHGAPEWLDREKLASLGFDVSRLSDERRAGRRYERLLPREALVVLELDGPARRKALERARKRAEEEAAKAAAGKGKIGPGSPAQSAAEFLKREETSNSRLFAVDAGLDAQALRARYPDRARYAIVKGKVRAQYHGGRAGDAQWSGFIEGLDNVQISVPLEFRKGLGSAVDLPTTIHPIPAMAEVGPPFELTVAFGKRLEPWVVSASGAAR